MAWAPWALSLCMLLMGRGVEPAATVSAEAVESADGSASAQAASSPRTLTMEGPGPAERALLAEVEALDRRLSSAEYGVQIAETNRRQAESTLADAQAAKASAEMRYARASKALAKRLGAAMRGTAGARWALLGGSASISDFVDRQRLLDATAAHDAQLWRTQRAAKETLEAASLFAEQTRAQLLAATENRRQQRDALAQRRRQRSERLRGLRKSREARLALRAEQTEATHKLQRMASGDGAGGRNARFAALQGALPWPAEGPVKKAFGQRIELTFGTATAHNGLDIAAPAGAPVQAVADGKVVWADWLRGFGQVVIVEHGEGYHAVFAHLSRIQVGRGERVTARQRLGLVGDTGSLRGTVLYFEIRRQGVPQDPRPWLGSMG